MANLFSGRFNLLLLVIAKKKLFADLDRREHESTAKNSINLRSALCKQRFYIIISNIYKNMLSQHIGNYY